MPPDGNNMQTMSQSDLIFTCCKQYFKTNETVVT